MDFNVNSALPVPNGAGNWLSLVVVSVENEGGITDVFGSDCFPVTPFASVGREDLPLVERLEFGLAPWHSEHEDAWMGFSLVHAEHFQTDSLDCGTGEGALVDNVGNFGVVVTAVLLI